MSSKDLGAKGTRLASPWSKKQQQKAMDELEDEIRKHIRKRLDEPNIS